jgi:hypothetical protein
MGCFDTLVSVTTQFRTKIIHGDKKDVRKCVLFYNRGLPSRTGKQQGKAERQERKREHMMKTSHFE